MIEKVYDNSLHIFDKMWSDYQKDLGVEQSIFQQLPHRDDYIIIVDKEIVGFILVGTFPNALCKDDIFIQDIYIKPDKRKKGLATSAVIDVWNNRRYQDKECLSLFILKNNIGAKEFWLKLTQRLGLTDRLAMGGITATTDEAQFHLFCPYKE